LINKTFKLTVDDFAWSGDKATSGDEKKYGGCTCDDPPAGWIQKEFNVNDKFDDGDT